MKAFWILCVSWWFLFPIVQDAPLRFEVRIASGLTAAPQNGRLFVIISAREQPEARNSIGQTGVDAPPVLARDVNAFTSGVTATIDRNAAIFPVARLEDIPAGDYFVQALFDSNIDLKSVNSPGNLYSVPRKVHLDPRRGGTVALELTSVVPPEDLPPEDEYVKYVRIQSDLLTRFHGRPIYLRAGIILPKDYSRDTRRRYPLRVHIGGYGTRFTSVRRMMAENSEFRRMWLGESTPRMIYLHLDGDGPYGDAYQVNSDNNGPYGDAITRELIPYVEQRFRGVGEPSARIVDGSSTGGWVSLALKVFYPDFFNAVWSFCPDGVDFRGFQLIDIYKDKNAYVDGKGIEIPSARDLNGNVRFTIRHECQMENVMGLSDSWAMSGAQWGAWNAAYGPRGRDRRPVPLWDAKTGDINKEVIEHWKKYDLRMVLEQNWKTLGPKIRGKLNIWVGEADDYYLNNAVHMLDDFFKRIQPPADSRIFYGPGRGHCWQGITESQMMDEMEAAVVRANGQ